MLAALPARRRSDPRVRTRHARADVGRARSSPACSRTSNGRRSQAIPCTRRGWRRCTPRSWASRSSSASRSRAGSAISGASRSRPNELDVLAQTRARRCRRRSCATKRARCAPDSTERANVVHRTAADVPARYRALPARGAAAARVRAAVPGDDARRARGRPGVRRRAHRARQRGRRRRRALRRRHDGAHRAGVGARPTAGSRSRSWASVASVSNGGSPTSRIRAPRSSRSRSRAEPPAPDELVPPVVALLHECNQLVAVCRGSPTPRSRTCRPIRSRRRTRSPRSRRSVRSTRSVARLARCAASVPRELSRHRSCGRLDALAPAAAPTRPRRWVASAMNDSTRGADR